MAPILLAPEDALTRFMQVKPVKENQMPKFKHGNRVKVVEGRYTGQTGVIWGAPNQIPVTSAQTVGDGQAIGGQEQTLYEYKVDLDSSDVETVPIMEEELVAA